MSPVRIAVIVLAALVGSIGLAFFARSLAGGNSHAKVIAAAPVVIEAPQTRVLVAAHDLQPGDRLTTGDFTWQPWPQSGVNPLFITDGAAGPSAKAPVTDKIAAAATIKARDTLSGGLEGGAADFVGAIVREPLLKGEPLVRSKVVKGTDAGMLAVSLDPGMRAMAVPLTAESAAGGFILPGDHVDVVQSRKVDGPNGAQKYASGAVLRNVKVLAVDQMTKGSQKSPGAAQIGQTATLEVTPDQAELLALSKSQGELTLILRSYADTAGPTSAGGGPRLAQAVTVAPSVVKVFRNGSPADVMVPR
jgi:pilus assembly protein CpaB